MPDDISLDAFIQRLPTKKLRGNVRHIVATYRCQSIEDLARLTPKKLERLRYGTQTIEQIDHELRMVDYKLSYKPSELDRRTDYTIELLINGTPIKADIPKGSPLSLPAVTRLYELGQERRSEEEISDALLDEYGVVVGKKTIRALYKRANLYKPK